MGFTTFASTEENQLYCHNMSEVSNQQSLEAQFFTREQILAYQTYWMYIEAIQEVAQAEQTARAVRVTQPTQATQAVQDAKAPQIAKITRASCEMTARLLKAEASKVASRIDIAQNALKASLQGQSYRRDTSKIRSRSASPPRDRTHLVPSQVARGKIIFLPQQEHTKGCFKCIIKDCKNCGIDDGAFNHPVVVIEKTWDGRQTSVSCCLITSKPRVDPSAAGFNLPICAATEVESSIEESVHNMYLEVGQMFKSCYIQTNHVFSIPLSNLRTFGHQKLSEKSFERLNSYLNMPTGDKSV